MKNKNNGNQSTRVSIIKTVQTPLGFFTLTVLVVEMILGVTANFSQGKDRTYLIDSMIVLIFLLVVLTAIFAYFRPEALRGIRPVITKIHPSGNKELDQASQITDLILVQKRNKITPDEFERYSDKIMGLKRYSGNWTIDPLKPGEVGPNGYRVGYTIEGDKVEWIPEDENPREEWPMILRRNDKDINAAEKEYWDKVWWNRHQMWIYRIKSGEEPLKDEQKSLLEVAQKAARKIEKQYGLKHFKWGDYEYGLLTGRLSALAWVTGADWESSMDT